jgi:branched-chain amino acid transport system ATP-binding protein
MNPVLAVRHLCKTFHGVAAVRDVSFDVAAGEMLALIGPNGAGKSTIFNIVGGQLAPDSGQVTLQGEGISGLDPRAIWRRGTGRTFQVAQTFNSMSVIENVQMALISAKRRSFNAWSRAADLYRDEAWHFLKMIGMEADADRTCSALGYAEIKRIEFAIAMATSPKLLLMDEPTAGMGLGDRAELMSLVARTAREQSVAVLFTEHDINAVFTHAHRVLVLVRGQPLAVGTPAEIRDDPKVRSSYLGKHGTDAHSSLVANPPR